MAGKAEGVAMFVYLAEDRLYPRKLDMGKTVIIFIEMLSARKTVKDLI